MHRTSRTLILVAGISLMLAGMLGAYGFHGLPGKVPDAKLASWDWAVEMQFFHSIGLILVALLLDRAPGSLLLKAAAGLMIAGLVLFSLNIYQETLGGSEAIGNLAPTGGSSFMLAWLLAGVGTYRGLK